MLRLHCLSVLLFVAAAPTQTAAAAPTDVPHVLIETMGPDGWRSRLGPTNLGTLLASEQGRLLWEPQVLPLLGYWQQMVGDEALFTATRDRLFNYGGRVRIGLWMSPSAPGEPERVDQAIVIEGDGTTDLAALAKDLRQLEDLLPGEWVQVTVADTTFDVRRDGDSMSAPFVGDNHILIVGTTGDQLDAAMRRGRTFASTSTGKAPPLTEPALRVSLDLASIVELQNDGTDEDGWLMMQGLGFGSLGRLQTTLGTAGPRVKLEVAQQFLKEDRGVFSVLCPAAAGLPRLMGMAGTGPGSWQVGHFDLLALHDVILAAAESAFEESREKMRADMKKELGIDLRDDLLAHMTDEYLLHLSPLRGLDRFTDVTWTFGMRLKDEASFKKGLQTMMPNARPLLQREATIDVDGVELQRFGNMFSYDAWVAVGHGTFLLACGRDAEEQLTALVHGAKKLSAEAVSDVATPKSFAELQRFLPGGLNSLAASELDSVLAMPVDWWIELIAELSPLPVDGAVTIDEEQVTAIRELLRQHKLDTIRSASGYADQHWRLCMYW